MFGKKKKPHHDWEYLPYFILHQGVVVCVQVCKATGACRYVRVPSAKKLEELEQAE